MLKRIVSQLDNTHFVMHSRIVVNGTKDPAREIPRCFNARISCFQAEFLDGIPRNPFGSFVRGAWEYSLSSSRERTEHFKRAQAGSCPRFNAELYEDFEDMLFHCGFAIAKNRCDLPICFTLGEPQQRFSDARSQAECRFQRSGRVEVRLEFRHGLLDGALKTRADGGKEIRFCDGFG